MIRKKTWFIPAALAVALSLGLPARADYYGAPPPTRGLVGIKAGFITGANFKADRKLKTDPGLSGGVFFDFPVSSKLYTGVAIDFHNMVLGRDQKAMIDIGLTFKHLFELKKQKMTLVPVASAGYVYIPDLSFFESSQYLNLKLFFETRFKINRKRSWVGDLGVSYMPVGGTQHIDIEIGPTFFVRWGVAFR